MFHPVILNGAKRSEESQILRFAQDDDGEILRFAQDDDGEILRFAQDDNDDAICHSERSATCSTPSF